MVLWRLFGALLIIWDFHATITDASEFPRIVWTYWQGDITPWLAKIMDYTHHTIEQNWTFMFLTPRNITDYLDSNMVPQCVWSLWPQILSDYVRVALLAKYGGWWIDASVIITSVSKLNDLVEELIEKNADSISFYHPKCPKHYIETSVLYSRKNGLLLRAWYEEMKRLMIIGMRNYLYTINRNGIDFPPGVFNPYPLVNIHWSVFAVCFQTVHRNISRSIKMISYPVYENSYLLHVKCKWNESCIQETLNNPNEMRRFPIIKLTHQNRAFLDSQNREVHVPEIDTAELTLGNNVVKSVFFRNIITILLQSVSFIIPFIFLCCCFLT